MAPRPRTPACASPASELQIHSNSCWTANGPASLVGSFTVTDTTGRDVPNPVNAFDGGFDPDTTPASRT